MKDSNASNIVQRATYQDVLDAPSNKIAEIIDGKLYTHSRPAHPHNTAQAGIGYRLGPHFHHGDNGPGGWIIFSRPELSLGKDLLVPNYSGWRRSRMPTPPIPTPYTVIPDWVCEILSPSTFSLYIGRKSEIYAREGVNYRWLIDPVEHWLEASVLHGSTWLVIDKLFDDASVSLPPFEAISFNLADLWLPTGIVHRAVPEMLMADSRTDQVQSAK